MLNRLHAGVLFRPRAQLRSRVDDFEPRDAFILVLRCVARRRLE